MYDMTKDLKMIYGGFFGGWKIKVANISEDTYVIDIYWSNILITQKRLFPNSKYNMVDRTLRALYVAVLKTYNSWAEIRTEYQRDGVRLITIDNDMSFRLTPIGSVYLNDAWDKADEFDIC